MLKFKLDNEKALYRIAIKIMVRFVGPFLRCQRRHSSTLLKAINGRSKDQFELALAANPVLQRLWNTPHSVSKTDTLNATNTLPIVLRSKDAVFHDVSKENADMQGLTLKLKQFTTYFKAVIYFYRIGIQNVWRNRKLMTQIKCKYHVESIEARGEVIKRKLRNGQDIVNSLIALETFERIEQEALKTIDPTLILNITRKEFQTVLRTERDIFKIPLFAVILVIFAEMTPLLCYKIPEVAPSTCVFPGLVKKMHHHATKAQADLSRLRMERYSKSYSHDEYPFQSVERLPDDELRLLAQSLNLTSRYLPIGLYPSIILQSRIMKRFNEIRVDNFFLVTGKQNLWNLNKNELIRCCIDRSLVDFSKDNLNHIGVHELRMRLFFFLGLCENEKSIGNVGLLGLNHLKSDQSVHFTNIQQEEAHVLNTWWAEKHKTDIVEE